MPRPLQVFLCHASQDKPYVLRLHRFLKQHGVQPWLDREELLPGQNWAVEISKALDASDVILVCLSKNSISKEGFVQKEISFALDKALEKPEGMIFIIPVKLEECELPRSLSRYHWVDLFRDGGRKRLLMGLNRRVIELGEEVMPIIMEDTRQRTPKPHKIEIKQDEPVSLLSSEEKVEQESKAETQITPPLQNDETTKETLGIEVQKEEPIVESFPLPQDKTTNAEFKSKPVVEKKPYTKILDPSSLNPSQPKESKQRDRKSIQSNLRWLGIGGLILFVLTCGGFGLNYLIQNLPINPTPEITTTPAFTSVPVTFTPRLTETLIPTPTLGIGSTMISNKDGMTLLFVPAGEFTMGSDLNSDEQPIHQVNLDDYWVDQTEVTNAMYSKCVADGVCKVSEDTSSSTQTSYYGNSEFDDFPVIYVDWNMANDYCSWAGRELPTEAQWEKAARGTDGRTYPWGEDISCDKANYQGSCVGDTTKVGSYLDGVSPYGIYDMAGNVWEWVSDWYDEKYYESSPSSNPLGPDSGQYRVLRGGSWNNFDVIVRSAIRYWDDPSLTNLIIGFRCSRSP